MVDRSRGRSPRWLAGLYAAALVGAPSPTFAQAPLYDVIELGMPDAAGIVAEPNLISVRVTHAWPAALNDSRVIVGGYTVEISYDDAGTTRYNSATRTFRWESGVFTDLGQLKPFGQYTPSVWASDINDAGEIVGQSAIGRVTVGGQDYFPHHPFRLRPGRTMEDLLSPGDHRGGNAAAINARGDIAGSVDWRAVLWEGGVRTPLGILSPTEMQSPIGINDAGVVVGETADTVSGRFRAFRWTAAGGIEPLATGVPADSTATAVNTDGVVAGAIRESQYWEPTRWEGGVQVRGFVVTPQGGIPRAINRHKQVVGYMRGTSDWRAFLWTEALAAPFVNPWQYDLNRMIAPGSGWALESAEDINDRGEIVGSGRRNGQIAMFVLVPRTDGVPDLDADATGDGLIDDADEPEEEQPRRAVAPPNLDDDDADGVEDGENDRVDGGLDRDDLARVMARRPAGIAPTAAARAVLRRVGGDGAIRVFVGAPGGERLVLGPSATESGDLWPELAAGDLTFLVEGVSKGTVLLQLRVDAGDGPRDDQVRLWVPGFELRIEAADPFLDLTDPFAAGALEVPADHVAYDLDGAAAPRAVNLSATYVREDERESGRAPPPRAVRWEVDAVGAAQQARMPGLRDLRDRAGTFQPRIDAADVLAYVSHVQLDMSFAHPRSGAAWIRAGDLFRVRVSARDAGGATLVEERLVRVVPGSKHFHVAAPPHDLDPTRLWLQSDAEFAAAFANARLNVPLGSNDSEVFEWIVTDAYRNLLPRDHPVVVELTGSGMLGRPEGDDVPETMGTVRTTVLEEGRVRVEFTQTTFPNCPWQPETELEAAEPLLSIDGYLEPGSTSLVDRADPLPSRLPDLTMERAQFTITPGFHTPDAHRGDTREFAVVVRRGTPVEGVKVKFSSTNGALAPPDGREVTNRSGIAWVTLTAKDARPGEPILVVAAVGTEAVTASETGMRWISSAPVQVAPMTSVIVGDATTGGTVVVETLQDRGEALATGGPEGDGFIAFPFEPRTTVNVTGPANHVLMVDVTERRAWRLRARYPLDVVTGGRTPEPEGGGDGIVTGGAIDPAERVEGQGSFTFDGQARIDLPEAPAIDAAGGLLIELWVRPGTHRGMLVDRPGQYRVDVVEAGAAAGRVRLQLWSTPSAVPVELLSAEPLPLDQWSFVEVRFDTASVRLGVGASPERLDAVFTGAMTPSPVSGAGATLGSGLTGRLDDVRFTKGGAAPPLLRAVGLRSDGTLVTDASGRASFTLESAGVWDPSEYRPVEVLVEVTGSPKGKARVQVVPKSIWGHLMHVGKAFLMGEEGLGADANWLQRAAAWVSENAPLLSDLRTLTMEVYKGATGCDQVSYMNVTFALVGLISDVASVGAGRVALGAVEGAVWAVAKGALREFATNVAMSAASQVAITGFVRLTTTSAVEAEGQATAPSWINKTSEFLTSWAAWAAGAVTSAIDTASRSVNDLLGWQAIHGSLGAAGTESLLRRVDDLGGLLEATP